MEVKIKVIDQPKNQYFHRKSQLSDLKKIINLKPKRI